MVPQGKGAHECSNGQNMQSLARGWPFHVSTEPNGALVPFRGAGPL